MAAGSLAREVSPVLIGFVSRFMFRRQSLAGASLLRVGLSAIMLWHYLVHAGLRAVVWGTHGQLDYVHYAALVSDPLALYRYSAAPFYALALFWLSVLIALAYLVGFYPRVVGWMFAVTCYAAWQRNTLAADGGYMLLSLLAFLLCFADTSRRFVLLRPRRRSRPAAVRILSNVIHNAASFAIAWQVCMVYTWAAFYKLSGARWRDGTALSYILRTEHFMWFPVASLAIAHNAVMVALLTYGTVAFQCAFPFLMWNRRLKPYLIGTGVVLHVSIAILMGLLSFSATMIFADLALLSDRHLATLARFRANATEWRPRAGYITALITKWRTE